MRIRVDLPQPVAPTMATYCPGLIFSDKSSRMRGISSRYRKDTLLTSIAPEMRSITCLPSDTSGSASMMGLAMAITGRNCARVIAMPARDMNAPLTMP